MSKAVSDLKDKLSDLFHQMAREPVTNVDVIARFKREQVDLIRAATPDLLDISLARLLPLLRLRGATSRLAVPHDDLFSGKVLSQITVVDIEGEVGDRGRQNIMLGKMTFAEAEQYVARNKVKSKPRPSTQYEMFYRKYEIARPYMEKDESLNVDDALEIAKQKEEEKKSSK